MSRLLSIVLIGLLLSCSILEDSDITSYDELKKLKLNGIEFTQALNEGTYSRGIPATDSVLNISLPVGKLTKQTKMVWGNVDANSKFKFRSGATADITIVNWYFDNGNIRNSQVYSGSTLRELYKFSYNSTGKIHSLKRILYTDPNDLNKWTYTGDTIFYDPNGIFFGAGMRQSNDATKNGIFGIEPISSNPCDLVWVFKRLANTNLGIPEVVKEYDYCGPTNFYIYPGGQSADFHSLGSDVLEEVYIGDRFTETDKKCCADQYYYHPVLFLPIDIRYKVMYAIDWWEEITPTSPAPNTESVRFTFNYGL